MNPEGRVAEARRRLNGRVAAIRENDSLTESGRRDAIRRAFASARSEVNAARSDWRAELAEEQQRLEARAFGVPAGSGTAEIVSYRDALDRVTESVTSSDEAVRAMDRAVRRGDLLLAKAVMTVAAEHGWRTPVERYSEHDSDSVDAVKALRLIEERQASPAERLKESMVFSLSPPKEIADLSPYELAQEAPHER